MDWLHFMKACIKCHLIGPGLETWPQGKRKVCQPKQTWPRSVDTEVKVTGMTWVGAEEDQPELSALEFCCSRMFLEESKVINPRHLLKKSLSALSKAHIYKFYEGNFFLIMKGNKLVNHWNATFHFIWNKIHIDTQCIYTKIVK